MQDIAQWPAGATATMNVTYTQANAAGGAVVCEISPGGGNEFIIIGGEAINSGTNGLTILVEGSVGSVAAAIYVLDSIGSGAGTKASVPQTASNSATTSGIADSTSTLTRLISGTQALKIAQTAAGAQNDTLNILMNIRTRGGVPSVTHANSTNPANVSVTAGTEAFVTL